MSQTINERIIIARKLANLTQAEVAERLDMKSSTFSQMERQGKISSDMILKLSKILNVKPMYLLCGETNNELLKESDIFPKKEQNTSFVLSRQEENIIKIMRNLKKDARKEAYEFLQKLYNESR
ncbi:MAG: helix-turn-helix transcriptional regulator [Clostridia bacterium]|nr:helix-turn-helix transcriptional regulator [Clostridia bacterium]